MSGVPVLAAFVRELEAQLDARIRECLDISGMMAESATSPKEFKRDMAVMATTLAEVLRAVHDAAGKVL